MEIYYEFEGQIFVLVKIYITEKLTFSELQNIKVKAQKYTNFPLQIRGF